ncbi:hypothetical protein XENOCAPTIV_022677, partial [Xenoophorus captivus]
VNGAFCFRLCSTRHRCALDAFKRCLSGVVVTLYHMLDFCLMSLTNRSSRSDGTVL